MPDALEALASRHPLPALTNAGSAQAFAMFGHAGLRWTTLLSEEAVQAYKPDPRMYQHALASLDLASLDLDQRGRRTGVSGAALSTMEA